MLIQVAQAIKDSIREIDHAARYGGEEFLVLFPNTDLAGAQTAAESIRARVEALVWQEPGLVTAVSGGIAEFSDQSEAELIDTADQLLYCAKQQGRNQVLSIENKQP